MGRESLLIDACVAINICATDELPRIASALSITFLMVREAAGEVRELRELVDDETVVTAIDLTSYGQDNLQLTELLEAEYETFVDLAKLVDDGEAATISVARIRGISLATDDRKARTVCAKYDVSEPVRTSDVLKRYAETVDLEETEIRSLLLMVHQRASFRPSKSDPNFDWWRRFGSA